MATVMVYEFEVYDPVRRRWTKSSQLGTLQAIERRGGVPLMRTGLQIDEERVDAEGLVTPPRMVT